MLSYFHKKTLRSFFFSFSKVEIAFEWLLPWLPNLEPNKTAETGTQKDVYNAHDLIHKNCDSELWKAFPDALWSTPKEGRETYSVCTKFINRADSPFWSTRSSVATIFCLMWAFTAHSCSLPLVLLSASPDLSRGNSREQESDSLLSHRITWNDEIWLLWIYSAKKALCPFTYVVQCTHLPFQNDFSATEVRTLQSLRKAERADGGELAGGSILKEWWRYFQYLMCWKISGKENDVKLASVW